MSVRLFVGNLPYDATEQDLRELFSPVGTLSYVFIPTDRETGKKRGFAFVEFADAEQAQEAIRQFNSQLFKGRPLAVNEARARDASPRSGGGGIRSSTSQRTTGPTRDLGQDLGDSGISSRGERPNRKQFGPDARPARLRSQKFRPEGGKRAFKEKFTGQIFAVDDDDDLADDIEIDNFATRADDDEES